MPAPYILNSPEARDEFTRLVLAYQGAETNLVRLVAQAVRNLAATDEDFYNRQLTMTRWLRIQAEKVLKELEGEVAKPLQTMIRTEYDTTAELAAGKPIAQGVNVAAVDALAAETIEAAQTALNPLLRYVMDTYREIGQQAVIDLITSGERRIDAVQQMVNRFADRGVVAFRDVTGRNWNIATYSEMVLRTGVNRAQNQGRRDGFQAAGVDLIVTSSHMGCAPPCLPFQGKILALTGSPGLREVTTPTGERMTVEVTATLTQAEAHGYHHVNCRHTDVAYIPGMPIPEPLRTDATDYDLVQRQRAIERNIRKWKRRHAAALNPHYAEIAQRRVEMWQAEQRRHVAQKDWLVRQYDREKVIAAERRKN
ncbi:hypothetical protein CPHO_08355 [Corynebacterium phocae]|uniref:Capsid protein n=1 Tax=Corynebacterium phocae TaxID=161895 RepID=A0A1L7D405_9CORY|nr:phage minor capsid protein [Corynebacterium phocae]APT92896.1 hypothetical protein CPHO_08355 [Corynebacterium phocae]KAA8723218.1 hypothetical protein F4V58_07850 [Corynebacterium phocae]